MKDDVFETMPIPKAVATLAIPTMLGMIVIIVYNLADTFFVGQMNDANQVAAVTIATPVFMVLMALGSIFGIGGGTYISRLLGSKDRATAKKTAAFAFYACLALSVVCMIFGFIFMTPILNSIGASGNTLGFARSYLLVILLGAPVIMLSFSMGQVIRAEGAAKESVIGMMIGTIINIVLDPVFILTLHMGVTGAAIATVLANLISVAYYCHYFLKRSRYLSISIRDFSCEGKIVRNTFVIGSTASLNHLLMSFSNIVLNSFAASYGDSVVAAIGIAIKTTMLPVMLMIGLCQGVQPIIGYNFAANNRMRLHRTIEFTGAVGMTIGVLFSIPLFLASDLVVRLFINDAEVIRLGAHFLRVVLLPIPFLGILFLLTTVFQAMGKALPSLIMSISRQGIVFIPVIIVANALVGMNGIVYAQPLADIFSTVLALVFYIAIKRKGRHPKEANTSAVLSMGQGAADTPASGTVNP